VLLGFLLGLVLGWGLHAVLWQSAPGRPTEQKGILSQLRHPVVGIRLERAPLGEKEGISRPAEEWVARLGDRIRIQYGKESLRFVALEGRSSPISALLGLFLPEPRLYLNDRPLEPGVEITKLMKPEETLRYELVIRQSSGERPLGAISVHLQMDGKSWLARARLLLDPKDKRRCLEQALQANPEDTDILLALGRLLRDQKDVKSAIASFERIVQKEPSHVEARKALVELYWKNQPTKALKTLEALIKLDAEHRIDYYKQVALLQERLGLSSAETYRKILSLRKNDPEATQRIQQQYAQHLNQAKQWERKGDLRRAIRAAKQALEYQSTPEARKYLAGLYNNIGFAYAKEGNLRRAVANYLASLELDPNPATYLNLAQAYARSKKTSKAIDALKRAQALSPKDRNLQRGILLLWAELFLSEKEYGKAAEKYRALARLFPKDPEVHQALAAAYWKKGDLKGALSAYKKLIPLISSRPSKERAEVWKSVGDLHRLLGERGKDLKARLAHYDQALKAYEKAIDLNGKDKEAQELWEAVAEKRKELKIKLLQAS